MLTKVTKYEFWNLREKIKYNYHLKYVGDLWYFATIKGTKYLDKNGNVVAKASKDGYFVDDRLIELCN